MFVCFKGGLVYFKAVASKEIETTNRGKVMVLDNHGKHVNGIGKLGNRGSNTGAMHPGVSHFKMMKDL